jgi:hypothetical protein
MCSPQPTIRRDPGAIRSPRGLRLALCPDAVPGSTDQDRRVCNGRPPAKPGGLAMSRTNGSAADDHRVPGTSSAALLRVHEAGGVVFDYDGAPHDSHSRYTIAAVPSLVERVRGNVVEAM